MPSYPTTCGFPIPYNGGFKLAPKKATSSIATESKLTRSRSLITNNIYVVNFTFTFTQKSHRDTFRKWFLYDLNYGNMWFNANWLTELGFTAGEWVFRFVDPVSVDLKGYKDSFQVTMLMAPKNQNIVELGVLVENGMGGQYIDQNYPYGYEDFKCTDLEYFRTFRFNGQTLKIETIDWNLSNWTVVGTPYDLSGNIEDYNLRSMAAMRVDHCAIINGNASCKLRMIKFDNNAGTWSQLGTATTLTGYSTTKSKITRISDTEVALYDGSLKTLTTWAFNYGTNAWAVVGSSFDLSTYNTGLGSMTDDICCMGNNRIAFVYHEGQGSGTVTTKLVAFDWSGSSWSQSGNKLTVYASGSSNQASYSITGLSLTEIALTSDNNAGTVHTYERKITKFTLSSGTWSAGTPSAQFSNGGLPKIAAIKSTRIAVSRHGSSNMIMIEADFNGSTFVDSGNELIVDSSVSSNDKITSFFLPE